MIEKYLLRQLLMLPVSERASRANQSGVQTKMKGIKVAQIIDQISE